MGLKPYYTSNSLIEAVKRNIAMPIAQVTFSNEDILAFANTEVFSAQLPSIMQYHDEYYVYDQDVPLVANKSRYQIPNRAIGMKLRDLTYKDQSGNLIEMSMVNPDDRSFYNGTFDHMQTAIHYYVQNNSIILVPEVSANPVGSLVFSYFLRPNSLVPDEQAIICSSFSKAITIDNTTLLAGDTFSVGSNTLTAGIDFAIGANSSITASNLGVAIGALSGFTTSVNNTIVTIVYSIRSTTFNTSNLAAFYYNDQITINSSQPVPSEIVPGVLVDFLQTDGGHSTYSFDVLVTTVSSSSITFSSYQIPEDFVIGDCICLQYQCIVPQVPTDLHNLLAERTCARILEAQGDEPGLKNANAKIQDLEARQATMISSRIDGSPQKIFNRHSLLRYGKSSRRGRF